MRRGAVAIVMENPIPGTGLELTGKVVVAEDRREYRPQLLLADEGQVTRAECTCPAFRKRRNRRCEYGALAQAETFPTEKAEKLVFDRSATEGGSELILSERWALNPGLIGKKFVRVQNFVAQEFVRGTVPLVGSRFGAEVDDPPGELAPVRPKIVVLDLKFRNRILGRKNERQIDIADIEWLPVQILGALVRKGAANLKISEVERVLAHGRAIAVSLRYYGGSDGGEVKNVAPVQRQLVGFSRFHDLTQR